MYTIPEDVLVAHLAGEAVLLNMTTKCYHRLNDTAAAVWKGLERGLDPAALVQSLCAEFEVEVHAAEQEMNRLLSELAERGLVAESSDSAAA